MEGERGRVRDLGITSPSIPTLHTHRHTNTKKLEFRVLSVSCAYLLLDTPADPRRETACLACRAVILGRALTASYAVLDISSKNGRAFLEYERTAGARAVLRHCCLFRPCIMSKRRVYTCCSGSSMQAVHTYQVVCMCSRQLSFKYFEDDYLGISSSLLSSSFPGSTLLCSSLGLCLCLCLSLCRSLCLGTRLSNAPTSEP